jgi:hypothetical protein
MQVDWSNAFTVNSKSASSKTAAVTIAVQTAAPGELDGSATFVATVKHTTEHDGHRRTHVVHERIIFGVAGSTVAGASAPGQLVIDPTRAAAKLLAKLKHVQLTIALTFTPTGADPGTATVSLAVSAPKTHASHHHH